MGSPANFNLWGECVAQYVALYKSCARNRASISVSKRRVGHIAKADIGYDVFGYIIKEIFSYPPHGRFLKVSATNAFL